VNPSDVGQNPYYKLIKQLAKKDTKHLQHHHQQLSASSPREYLIEDTDPITSFNEQKPLRTMFYVCVLLTNHNGSCLHFDKQGLRGIFTFP
jgi:hypothetical protein